MPYLTVVPDAWAFRVVCELQSWIRWWHNKSAPREKNPTRGAALLGGLVPKPPGRTLRDLKSLPPSPSYVGEVPGDGKSIMARSSTHFAHTLPGGRPIKIRATAYAENTPRRRKCAIQARSSAGMAACYSAVMQQLHEYYYSTLVR